AMFEQFDYPDPTMPTGSRGSTTVAPQALLVLNYELVMDSAKELARKLVDETSVGRTRVAMAYQNTLSRPPSEDEIKRTLDFVDSLTSKALTDAANIDPVAEHEAWTLFCQSLMASNEFFYIK
ncbi:MAG: DUF1553 domain-containing protein, partial [Verrucomicrobiota bacterium]